MLHFSNKHRDHKMLKRSPAYTAGDFFLDEDWKRSSMRNHAKSFRFGGSWAGIETEGPERAVEPPELEQIRWFVWAS